MIRGLRQNFLTGDDMSRVREAVERAWEGIADTVEEDGTIRNIIGGDHDHQYLRIIHFGSMTLRNGHQEH